MPPPAKKAAWKEIPSKSAGLSPSGETLPRTLLELLESERVEVAQQLHSQLGQQLTAAVLLLNLLHKNLGIARDSQLTSVARLASLLTDARQQLRQVMQALQPVGEASDGLAVALTEFLRQSGEECGVECRLQSAEPFLLESPFTGSVLFRVAEQIVRGALADRPKEIVLNLSHGDEAIVLDVFSLERKLLPSGIQTEKAAIAAAQVRVAAMGGTLTVESLPCRGARVRCLIPHPRISPSRT